MNDNDDQQLVMSEIISDYGMYTLHLHQTITLTLSSHFRTYSFPYFLLDFISARFTPVHFSAVFLFSLDFNSALFTRFHFRIFLLDFISMSFFQFFYSISFSYLFCLISLQQFLRDISTLFFYLNFTCLLNLISAKFTPIHFLR